MKVMTILYFPCMAITNLTQTGLHLSLNIMRIYAGLALNIQTVKT